MINNENLFFLPISHDSNNLAELFTKERTDVLLEVADKEILVTKVDTMILGVIRNGSCSSTKKYYGLKKICSKKRTLKEFFLEITTPFKQIY